MDAVARLTLETRWRKSLALVPLPLSAGDAVFADLVTRHGHPDRHYHTGDHLLAMFAVLDRLPAPPDPAAVALAVWFHDAVYDPRAADNEERSAELARTALTTLGVPASSLAEVVRLIQLTRTHQAGPDDGNAAVLLDADLAVLGASPAEYDAYAAAIAREYAWVPPDTYRTGRGRVLASFLARPRLFRTDLLRAEREETARANLRRELAALGGENFSHSPVP